MVIAVVDISAFGELYCLAQADPWILTPHGLWIAAGVSSALLASVLMLTCRDLKRLVALSSIEDFGFLILCIVCAGPLGETGALLGAAAHALGKALLFISLSSPEAAGQLDKQQGGLAACYPLSAVGFVVGMLTVLGIPPTFGFAGRWRVYEIAAQAGPALLLPLVMAEAFALIAFVRALTSVWWGAAATAPLMPHRAAATAPLMPRRVAAPAPPVPYRVATVMPFVAHSASRGV
jgi:multicomponent Na+:H+ antiporter subunit D